ncbi:MAG: ABC transporter permease, partial [Candidatus Aminicenantes bacterium]|nr:ABC transporter permease [Candidatus Aminicenantes bacterium]
LGFHTADLPEFEHMVRFYSRKTPLISTDHLQFEVKDFVFTEPSVFDVFTLPLLRGDPETVLNAPFSVVLTENLARTIFGDEDPLGKTLRYDNAFTFTVTGVMKDVERFHIRIRALASFNSLQQVTGLKNFLEEYQWWFPTYVLVRENTDLESLNKKIQDRLQQRIGLKGDYHLAAFKDIYFRRDIKFESGIQHGNKQMIGFFTVVALLILLIANVNFINMMTAQASIRSREVSIRKIVGAGRATIIQQILGEIGLYAFLSFCLALFIIKATLPLFQRLTETTFALHFTSPTFIGILLGTFLFTVLAAGIYPSLYFSSFDPNTLLQGRKFTGGRQSLGKKALIVCQFTITIFLLIGTTAVLRQIRYMKNADLGFTHDQVIHLTLKGRLRGGSKFSFKNRLLSNPSVRGVSFSVQPLGGKPDQNPWTVQGITKQMSIIYTDPDFIDLMDLQLIAGRNFDWKRSSDASVKYVLNEQAVKYLGLTDPVGSIVQANFGPSEVIGLVKDFHFQSLHNSIGPLAIAFYPPWANTANIKISGENIPDTLKAVGKVWRDYAPDFPFLFSFLDESFSDLYRRETKLAELLKYFTYLALLMANLGLFGLTAFLVELRTKEIGIRKTLGASISDILGLFSRQFSRWVFIANIIA